MASFLTLLGPLLSGAGKVAGIALPAAVGSIGGPLASAVTTSVLNLIVAAENSHMAKVTAAAPTGAPVADTRQAEVIQAFLSAMPLIEALAAALGHPIPDPAAFEALLPDTINTMVAALNAQAKMLALLGVKL